MKILSLPIEKEAHLRTKKVIIHFEILTSLIQKAKLFNQFNNKELSDELTKLYRDKILILNYSKDCYN